jgi:tRNA threonylcarbamoyladenosine biosynthesis protein TsaB
MLILTLRTDKPDAEIGLYDDQTQLHYETWLAHRQLAETLHSKIAELLEGQAKQLHNIQGIVVFKGPGSFTGLRIGITVANALGYSLSAAVIASENPGWLETGITRLLAGEADTVAIPEYGALPNITLQKK